jgi:aspartate ammonia-lyase
MTRREKDYLGHMDLPEDVLFGIQTLRAVNNFPISGIRFDDDLVMAYVILKKASALANLELGELDAERGEAIVLAADQVLAGRFLDQFVVDVFQAGAGTSFNMNVNEVLANLALDILGRDRGDYGYLSPNDHVNRGQSSNDTFPTASHLAIHFSAQRLLGELEDLADAFEGKGLEFEDVVKSGRTHLMDALPVTLGQEFNAYASAIRRSVGRIEERLDDLLELPIGGTAVGTGAGSVPGFREEVLERLRDLTDLPVTAASDPFELLQSRSQMTSISSSLKELALELVRIANDLRLLASGPTTGLGEIILPPVQPGSSMMPGKVNPSMAECLNMVCFQVIGNDTAVSMASQAGQLELNVMTPVITFDILWSMELLENSARMFRTKCVEGIDADEERCAAYLDRNPVLGTFLAERIGYMRAAEVVKESARTGIPVPELAVRKGLLSEEEARTLFDHRRMVGRR